MTRKSDDLVSLYQPPPEGNNDMGFHQGVVQSWDELTGVNTVLVNGTVLSNLRVIQSGIGVTFQPTDVVALMRFQTTYFIMGKIAAPGASAAQQIRSAFVAAQVTSATGIPTTYGDLTGSVGPVIQDVFIGSSRRCLVMHSEYGENDLSVSDVSVEVSGASAIAAGAFGALTSRMGVSAVAPGPSLALTVSRIGLLTAAEGLNKGFNTFTLKYKWTNLGSGSALIGSRNITVIPF